ncbi:PDZK1-interacting protein 1 isoform X2 [Erythrolamprus reginae]|uniref:PDZK1-interacting protein 1 isoform X2 n=1 Tax=Erythrolamprus reginae TaxID=121349 RepID=UPI00396CA6F8
MFIIMRPLEPWLTGVIAVSVFLVLTMMAFIINKLWCQDKKDSKGDKQTPFRNSKGSITSNGMEGAYSTHAADFSCEEGAHVYENQDVLECDTMAVHHTANHDSFGFHCDTMTECHTDNHADVTTAM